MTERKRRSKADLLGTSDDKPAKKRASRSTKEEEYVESDWSVIRNGVSAHWLSKLIGKAPQTIQRKLKGVKPASHKGPRGETLYPLMEALSRLVPPKEEDLVDFIRNMSKSELPYQLQRDYWDAENKRLNYMVRAGELWHTEDVLHVLGEAFQAIKTSTQTWVDDMERLGLDKRQYDELSKKVDSLREEIYKALVTMPEEMATENVLGQDGVADEEDIEDADEDQEGEVPDD